MFSNLVYATVALLVVIWTLYRFKIKVFPLGPSRGVSESRARYLYLDEHPILFRTFGLGLILTMLGVSLGVSLPEKTASVAFMLAGVGMLIFLVSWGGALFRTSPGNKKQP